MLTLNLENVRRSILDDSESGRAVSFWNIEIKARLRRAERAC